MRRRRARAEQAVADIDNELRVLEDELRQARATAASTITPHVPDVVVRPAQPDPARWPLNLAGRHGLSGGNPLVAIVDSMVLAFRGVFSRQATFDWFVIVVWGFLLRGDADGVTSTVRCFGLAASEYYTVPGG